MNKKSEVTTLTLLFIILLFIWVAFSFIAALCGGIPYGGGSTYGYVTTIEQGGFWEYNLYGLNHVWVRADLASSNTDCYIINDIDLENQLRQTAMSKQRIQLQFERRLFTGGCSSDKIVSYTITEGER